MKFHMFLYKQVLSVRKTTSNIQDIHRNTSVQILTMSSLFRRVHKVINEEIKTTNLGWIAKLRKISLPPPSERWIFSYRIKTNIKMKLIWTLITTIRLRLYSHNLAINTGKWYKLPGDHKICRQCWRNNTENEMHVLFDCENYDTLQQDILKKDKDNW